MKVLRFVGKLLISVGVGILLFVAWTLWGTGIYTQRAQARLSKEFGELPVFRVRPAPHAAVGGPPHSYRPGPGDPVFRLKMPSIGLDRIVVEGVNDEDLALGPGHYPSCRSGFVPPLCTDLQEVWPGQKGRVIVSGHRTTHGAPFWDLDKLHRGDRIVTQTRWGNFTYLVRGKEIVDPNAQDIANPKATNGFEIAFTTCNPKFSASQRLIVYAEMSTTP